LNRNSHGTNASAKTSQSNARQSGITQARQHRELYVRPSADDVRRTPATLESTDWRPF
jgi:hypothetical protein